METFKILLLIGLLICAIATALSKKILTSIIIFMAYSVIMSILWMLLESPDLAITEAAVGAGVTSVLFFLTLRRIHLIKEDKETKKIERKVRQYEVFNRIYPVLVVIFGGLLLCALLYVVADLPAIGRLDVPTLNEVSKRYIEKGMQETGAVNIVAGMILDYRAFDTLGESHVLFTAMCAVLILLLDEDNKLGTVGTMVETDAILRLTVNILFPIILIFGIYVILNGHISPGGGFSGGAIIGADLILYSATFGYEKTSRFMNMRVFKTVTLCSLCFYSLAKGYSFFCGANELESGISTGVPGRIISAGLILPLNIAVGLVVACTMYGIYSIFRRGKI